MLRRSLVLSVLALMSGSLSVSLAWSQWSYYYRTTLTVDPQVPWNDTGFNIEADKCYVLVPYGRVRVHGLDPMHPLDFGPDGGIWVRPGPGAGETGLMAGAPHMALIGRIGTDGIPLYIGKTTFLYGRMLGSGRLYLGVNDNLDNPSGWYDNEGTLWVDVYDATQTGVKGSQQPQPEPYLAQNRPNPFNPTTIISYAVQTTANVSIKVYDCSGKLVRTLVDETKKPGDYIVVWDGKDSNGNRLASGTYFYQLSVGDYISTKKAIVLK